MPGPGLSGLQGASSLPNGALLALMHPGHGPSQFSGLQPSQSSLSRLRYAQAIFGWFEILLESSSGFFRLSGVAGK